MNHKILKLLKIRDIILNITIKRNIYYIVESAAWSIRHDGMCLTKHIKNSTISMAAHGIRNSIVHFGSLSTFITDRGVRRVHKSNKVIVTCFHIDPGNPRNKYFIEADKNVDLWHTSCENTKSQMIALGISKDKIVVIPLGVDNAVFKPYSDVKRKEAREQLGISADMLVVGSFQKDGLGWGRGDEPKLIKGPDIFCDVIEKLKANHPNLFVLLSGPARGYVKKRLDKVGVPYRHDFLETPNELPKYYNACDLYIVASREEGGPKSILESWASGVPLVTTKVGMAPDIIVDPRESEENHGNGFLCDVEDVDSLVESCEIIIGNKIDVESIVAHALEDVKLFDWESIAERYEKELYSCRK